MLTASGSHVTDFDLQVCLLNIRPFVIDIITSDHRGDKRLRRNEV